MWNEKEERIVKIKQTNITHFFNNVASSKANVKNYKLSKNLPAIHKMKFRFSMFYSECYGS